MIFRITLAFPINGTYEGHASILGESDATSNTEKFSGKNKTVTINLALITPLGV